MRRSFASRFVAAASLIFIFGAGCGSSCGGLRKLPVDPKPLGFPSDQVIEGGIQARVTKPGMDKLIATLPTLFGGLAGNSGFCAVGAQHIVNIGIASLDACNMNNCPGGAVGCPAVLFLDSKNRPATPEWPIVAANNQDGVDGIGVTLLDGDTSQGTNPIVRVDAKFDLEVPIDLDLNSIFGNSSCTLFAYSPHLVDNNGAPEEIIADIALGVDALTGELNINLANIGLTNLNITTTGSGGACSFISPVVNTVIGFITTVLNSFIGNFIINTFLKPAINSLIQSFLPKPLGIAGTLDVSKLLGKFHPPKDDNLEMFIVPGGYVASSTGGLTLGVMSGMNSDRDQTTRTPGLTSEPSLCVPVRPTPDLSQMPWMLPFNASRKDFRLDRAGQFAGMPDPMFMGQTQDVAIGVSRTFFDLAGFHLYNSGSLCLAIGGDALPQLNAGTLSVIVGSLGNILEDRKAPLALVLRPQVPLSFTIGAGDMTDPLLHINASDLRIDFYAWVEERYVRILTLALDANLGLNLTVTKDPNTMKPAIQPMIVGLAASNVKIRVSNTDLLQEDPAALAQVFPSLINIAAGALGGAVKPIALPAVAGFALDNMQILKVQTTQDDFLGIYASIVAASSAPLVDWSDPNHPRLVGELETSAVVDKLVVPPASELKALFAAPGSPLAAPQGSRPSVTLRLDAQHADGLPVEYAYRIDGGWWHVWSQDANPTLSDDAFLLQGRHTIDVRSRVVNQWSTEDLSPASLVVLIDSVPPELHPAIDANDAARVAFNGFDLVSDTAALKYSWIDERGQRTPWSSVDGMSIDLARNLSRDGALPVQVFALDEAGNQGQVVLDTSSLLGFHGRTTNPPTAGCGCEVGRADTDRDRGGLAGSALLALGLLALVLLRRRRASLAALALALLTLHAAGCGCDDKANQCSIDDDCLKMQCKANQIPQCQNRMCLCSPDQGLGDVGRFSSMTMIGPTAYVAAYNNTYGDLMIGSIVPPGVIANWDFVDGVPEVPPDVPASHVRGGISDKGDDVGRYTSIQQNGSGEPVVAYFDKTHHALKFASFGAIRWHSHVVDKGLGMDEIGRWASMSMGPDGRPAIAYTASAYTQTPSGMPEGQLRFAQAKVARPQSSSDWSVTIVDSAPLAIASSGTPDGGAADGGAPVVGELLLPEGIGLMPSLARKVDGTPSIAYYDRTRGNLRFVEFDPTAAKWGAPLLLDGESMGMVDTGDVGLYPSLTYDEMNVGNISYVDATHDALLFVDTMNKLPEVVDDGYHPKDEMTQDGLDSPVFHLVGDSSSIDAASGQLVIAYQDSTVLQLRLAQRGPDGKWTNQLVAGHMMPFKGAYGFYASLRISNRQAIVSSYAINQHLDTPLFYVEVFSVNLGLIM